MILECRPDRQVPRGEDRTSAHSRMAITLAQTPLFDWHAAHGGRMVDFASWSMPVQYSSIVAEHHATRRAVGIFDVSHMGRLRFDGPQAEQFLDRLVTRRVTSMPAGQVRYALVTKHDGGILDDVLVYHLADHETGKPYYLMVVNASNRRKIGTWIAANHRQPDDVHVVDRTHETAMIAVQGPRALEVVKPLTASDPARLNYYHADETEILGTPSVLSRTGYTGEDGWELIVPADCAAEVWQSLLDSASAIGGLPAGLGCRDTLRLEAGMPLYGHELSEQINPLQAGLGFAVDLEGRSFPGSDVLEQLDRSELPKRVGLRLEGGRVPREGYAILRGADLVGRVTSGTFSPTLERPIAMGYVQPEFAAPAQELSIDIRGRAEPARVVKLPFYRRAS